MRKMYNWLNPEPTTKPLPDISEPAIQLIQMIESGEWDVVPHINKDGSTSGSHISLVFRDSQVKLQVAPYIAIDNFKQKYRLWLSWTTCDEKDAINTALTTLIGKRMEDTEIAVKLADRNAFKHLLEKTNEKLLS